MFGNSDADKAPLFTEQQCKSLTGARHLWGIKGILRLPPHLYSVTALPSKTYTTANIDAHV